MFAVVILFNHSPLLSPLFPLFHYFSFSLITLLSAFCVASESFAEEMQVYGAPACEQFLRMNN